jgi:predicted O-methyltransferase YrrM
LPPDYSDLWFLYQAVRTHRPTTLLEFGSGCSTVVLAFGLHQNGAGHLWSVDGEKAWVHATEAALPKDLRPFVTVVHSPVREDDRDVPGLSHEHVPGISPDFVYLDGPPLTRQRQVAFDVLDLEARLRPGCLIVIDGRRKNAQYLSRRLTRDYTMTRMVPWRYVFELRT